MNELQIFKNAEFGEVRTVDIDGKPYFVAGDVAKALGYSNPRKAVLDHCKGVTKRDILTTGGKQEVSVLPESDVYRLIVTSKLPCAERFERWVFEDVLPSIRKYGTYMTPDTLNKMIASPDFGIKLLTALKDEQDKSSALQQQIDKDKPLVIFAHSVSASKDTILISELAKLLKQNGIDTGQNRLYEWLRKSGYLIKRRGADYNMPTQRSMELGLFNIKETSISHTAGYTSISKTPKVTGKGQIYFINKFKTQQGIKGGLLNESENNRTVAQ